MIPFGEWLPDLPPNSNQGAAEALNVIPSGESYKQINALSAETDAIGARCQGGVSGMDESGNVYNFAGDATSIYKLTQGAWQDVSGSTYTIGESESWQWAQYGKDIIATNINDNIQKFTMGSDAAFSTLTTAVKARYIDTVREFLVVGNTSDSTDGAVPHRVRWAGQGTTTDWAVSSVTQADYQDLDASKGWVRQVVGGAYGIIFQEKAITRMTYVGSPLVFQFDQVESGRGTNSPNSVVKVGSNIFYLGENGFYVFDGESSIPIGANKIDKTFYSDFNESYQDRVYGVNDPINKLIIWLYAGSNSIGGIPDKLILYNYSTNKWAHAEINAECLVRTLAEGYTLDTMDSYNSSIDAISISMDSRFWTGGASLLAGFDSNHKMATFTGAALTAKIETGEHEIHKGRKTHLQRIRPVIDGGATTIQIGKRNRLSDTVSWGNEISLLTDGSAGVRDTSRYQRIRVNISSGFSFAQGVDIEGKPASAR